MLLNSGGSAIVTLFVSAEDVSSERRFSKSISIQDLKDRLQPITGVPAATMTLKLYTGENHNTLVALLDDDSKMLGYYAPQDFMLLHVIDSNPNRQKHAYSDVSGVCTSFLV
jgi:tubulin-folding cofactor B